MEHNSTYFIYQTWVDIWLLSPNSGLLLEESAPQLAKINGVKVDKKKR